MEKKFTQGEWITGEIFTHAVGVPELNVVVCDCCFDKDVPVGEQKANAKLIAAAPDLLSSLISLKERIDYLICTGRVDVNKMETIIDINIANDAIKKALS